MLADDYVPTTRGVKVVDEPNPSVNVVLFIALGVAVIVATIVIIRLVKRGGK